MMKTEVTSRKLAKLLGLTSSAITDLVKLKIIVSGSKRGSFRLQESIRNYVEHLRRLGAAQDSEGIIKLTERKKPLSPQAEVAKTAERMHNDGVVTSDLEKPERLKLRSFRNHLLGDDEKRGDLRPRDYVRLMTKRVRPFRIYIREGRCYTVLDG
jgi:hypothetical protein